jgi:hypothetical protein
MSSNKLDGTKGIKVTLILEIIGRPPEHLVETLEGIIKQIDAEKGVRVLDKKIREAVLLKDQKDLYSTFAEIDIEVEQISHVAILMFKYMPAHVEIVSPEIIALQNTGWSDIFSELTRRLHNYEELLRIMNAERFIMEKKLKALLPAEQASSVPVINEELNAPETKSEKKSRKKKDKNNESGQ